MGKKTLRALMEDTKHLYETINEYVDDCYLVLLPCVFPERSKRWACCFLEFEKEFVDFEVLSYGQTKRQAVENFRKEHCNA